MDGEGFVMLLQIDLVVVWCNTKSIRFLVFSPLFLDYFFCEGLTGLKFHFEKINA